MVTLHVMQQLGCFHIQLLSKHVKEDDHAWLGAKEVRIRQVSHTSEGSFSIFLNALVASSRLLLNLVDS